MEQGRRSTPEEQELEKKRAELVSLEADLVQRELDLATLRAELASFKPVTSGLSALYTPSWTKSRPRLLRLRLDVDLETLRSMKKPCKLAPKQRNPRRLPKPSKN